MSAESSISNEYDSLEFSMPYKKDDDNDIEMTDDDIELKNKWIADMCRRIQIDPQEVYGQNFVYFYDLAMWFWKNHYDTAQRIYGEKMNLFFDQWVRELCKKFKKYNRDDIEIAASYWLDNFFESGFIWGLDSSSVFDAKKWNDVSLFDTTPLEMFNDILTGSCCY